MTAASSPPSPHPGTTPDKSSAQAQRANTPKIRRRHVDQTQAAALEREGLHPVLARVLAARGIASARDIEHDLEGLIAPSRMAHIDEAAKLLAQSIERGDKLLIVADFDADGATACAVGMRGLKRFGAQVEYLVPDRFVFGYGLTPALVDHAHALHSNHPAKLIITVDNGISSIAGVARAKELGMQVLVTDHHLPGPQLPDTLIVNPNLADCSFPSKSIAGVGVMFYVLLALRAHVRDDLKWSSDRIARLDDLLPLVALGTVADVVKLDANNRRLVAQGLQRLRKGTSFAGLNALFASANIDVHDANASHLGFAIGPRINAAGRLADMSIGIRCLLEDDPARAAELAMELDQLNRERREIEAAARDDAVVRATQAMQQLQGTQERKSLVLHDSDWHQGVIGLIAGKIKESFYRPTIVFADDGTSGRIKGSARSIEGVHIRDVLERIDTLHPGLIIAFGGHAMAAGLTLAREHLETFREIFEATVHQFGSEEAFHQVLDTDGPLEPQFIALDIANLMERQVWGQGFPAPIFVNEFRVISQRRLKDRHLKLSLAMADAPGSSKLEAIWFNASRDLGPKESLAYRLGINDWQGRLSVQLEVVSVA